MKILILTSINPVSTVDLTKEIFNKYAKKAGIISFPFFANTQAYMANQAYIPTYFSMIKSSRDEPLHNKLFGNKHTIVIGNTLKDEKFDLVVAFEDVRNEFFDSYMSEVKESELFAPIREMLDINNFYELEDASVTLPTVDHMMLFLKGVIR